MSAHRISESAHDGPEEADETEMMWDNPRASHASKNQTSLSGLNQTYRENPTLPGFVDADSALAITRKVQYTGALQAEYNG
jgi:hypothetical protein